MCERINLHLLCSLGVQFPVSVLVMFLNLTVVAPKFNSLTKPAPA